MSHMAEIIVELEVNASVQTIWDIISDVDNEPTYWKGTKSVRNISKNDNIIKREITIAFRDQKCLQDVILHPPKQVESIFTDGIIKGTKSVYIIPKHTDDHILLRTVWNVQMTGMMSMFTGMLKGHIRNGTEIAMNAIKDAAEMHTV